MVDRSLGYLDSKTSLNIVLRVMIAARMHLKWGEAFLEGVRYSNCTGLTQAPQEMAIEHVTLLNSQYGHLENT